MGVVVIGGGGGGTGQQRSIAQTDDGDTVITTESGETVGIFKDAAAAARYLEHLARGKPVKVA